MSQQRFKFFRFVFKVALAAAASTATVASAADRVLIVVSGEGRDQGKTRPGYEFDELSQAWLIFRDNGLEVDVASPNGGAVEADKYNAKEPFNAQLLADAAAMKQLANTRAIRDLDADDYAAVYVVGGKGAMFDLPKEAALQTLIASIHDNGGVVAAVCHGPAALADVKLADGRWLVADRAVTGFSNEEEAIFGKKWAKEFPWLLEDRLRNRGAKWQEVALMMPGVAIDGRLITGQNPYSTTAVAEAIVRATGRELEPRESWRDERTLQLVQDYLTGPKSASVDALKARPDYYHTELIGLLGYYQLQSAAEDKAAIRNAIDVMELALPYMAAPELRLGLADGHSRLGDTTRARDMLKALLAEKPDLAEAKAMLAKLGN